MTQAGDGAAPAEKAVLTLADFRAMEALEAACYDAAYITPAAEAYAWYCRDPRTTVAAWDEAGALAGFVNLFPVPERVFAALLAGTYEDSGMTADDLAPAPGPQGRPLDLFLSCIAVAPAHRGTGLACALVRRAAAQYAPYPCARVVTDNVTEAGERFSRRCGLTPVCKSSHGSRVYAGDWASFLHAIREG